MHELILGGARSGKSRCAELRAAHWLALPGHSAVLIATAEAGDDEMHERIARHRADRAVRVPGLATREEPRALAAALQAESTPGRLVVVDCLTLWLTGLLMPLQGEPADASAETETLLAALAAARGPVIFVSNEIGLGVMPMSRQARHFVDELGRLHQRIGAACARVTLMVAGLELPLKGAR
ncbi:bifunctional adenosylcobinamide kinase/adenosylcobinamide-phosphate guanylyltransferase [Rubrivivax gelatinosus]|nr:bifunctional adenosylcobinamide kinase/adenosylcobinamide-phosphate guanylyltransferase [Rubrivivax gelatinosus]